MVTRTKIRSYWCFESSDSLLLSQIAVATTAVEEVSTGTVRTTIDWSAFASIDTSLGSSEN